MTHINLAQYFAAKAAREMPAVARRCEAEKWERCLANDERDKEAARAKPDIDAERYLQNCGVGS